MTRLKVPTVRQIRAEVALARLARLEQDLRRVAAEVKELKRQQRATKPDSICNESLQTGNAR